MRMTNFMQLFNRRQKRPFETYLSGTRQEVRKELERLFKTFTFSEKDKEYLSYWASRVYPTGIYTH